MIRASLSGIAAMTFVVPADERCPETVTGPGRTQELRGEPSGQVDVGDRSPHVINRGVNMCLDKCTWPVGEHDRITRAVPEDARNGDPAHRARVTSAPS